MNLLLKYYNKNFCTSLYKIFCTFFILYKFEEKLGLCRTFYQCYSYGIAYTLQVDSFLNGKISLASNPSYFMHDWGWGENGMHQLWGLGIPILRLPFEVISRYILGFKYFPDRLILLFYTFIAIFFSIYAISKLFQHYKFGPLLSITISFLINANIFLSTPLLNMLKYRIDVYEEAVFYSFLFCTFILSLSLIYLLKSNVKILYALCLFSGFAALIRPTAFIYMFSILTPLSIYLLTKKKIKLQIHLTLLFSIGVISTLILNFIRFGSILEFGYSLNLSSLSFNDYSLRFTYPFLNAPFSDAALELFSAIFLMPKLIGSITYDTIQLAYQTNLNRFRELTFHTFSYYYLLLFSISIVFILIEVLKCIYFKFKKFSIITYLSFFSLLSFSCMFAFYTYAPSIASRYILDFFLSINITILTFFIYLLSVISSKSFLKNK